MLLTDVVMPKDGEMIAGSGFWHVLDNHAEEDVQRMLSIRG